MVTTISQVGDSPSVLIDSALLERAHLKIGDQLNVTVDKEGTITLTPVRSTIDAEQAAATARRLIHRNSELFRRLS